jgi:hypothetical protein
LKQVRGGFPLSHVVDVPAKNLGIDLMWLFDVDCGIA